MIKYIKRLFCKHSYKNIKDRDNHIKIDGCSKCDKLRINMGNIGFAPWSWEEEEELTTRIFLKMKKLDSDLVIENLESCIEHFPVEIKNRIRVRVKYEKLFRLISKK